MDVAAAASVGLAPDLKKLGTNLVSKLLPCSGNVSGIQPRKRVEIMAEHVAKNGQDFETTVRRRVGICYDFLATSCHFAGARTPTIRSSNSLWAERALSIIRWTKGFQTWALGSSGCAFQHCCPSA